MADRAFTIVDVESGDHVKILAVDNGDGTHSLATTHNPASGGVGTGDVQTYTPVISASPDYAVGDDVGVGGTLTPPASGRPLELKSLVALDQAGQGPALTIYLFSIAPAGTHVDNAAFAWGTGESVAVIAVIEILASHWTTKLGKSHLNWSGIGHLMEPVAGAIGVHIVAESTYNAAAVDDLSFKFGIEAK